MTPKEKAIELIEQFMEHTVEWDKIKEIAFDSKFHSKQCALIAVDEIQQLIKNLSTCKSRFIYIIHEMNYFEEVKQEIEKL